MRKSGVSSVGSAVPAAEASNLPAVEDVECAPSLHGASVRLGVRNSTRGAYGEIKCLSAICLYSKYMWLRPFGAASAQEAVWALFSVICDAGVVPMKLLNERGRALRTRVLLEFTALLRARQSFSMALSSWFPEGHGVVERNHRELRKDAGRAIESVAGAHAAVWPRFVPHAEAVWRS